MSASFNNAILGPYLRVGTIPSVPKSPAFFTETTTVHSMDGGLVTTNGLAGAGGYVAPVTLNFWWIGPDGTSLDLTNNGATNQLAYDGYGDMYSGCWFDTEYNRWGAIPNPLNQHGKSYISYFTLYGKNYTPFYSQFPDVLFLDPLIAIGYFNQNYHYLNGGFSNNFCYGGIDQVICCTFPEFCDNQTNFIPMEISIPYGVSDMDFSGSKVGNTTLCGAISAAAPPMAYFSCGHNYRPGPGKDLFNIPSALNGYYFYNMSSSGVVNSGRWHMTTPTANPRYVGRLWNGFIFCNVFTNYTGCVYTDDMITFYPLKDISGIIDFSNATFFGFTGNSQSFFMSGFGFSYLAVYNQLTTPFTQAAYKIYPAFNFNPLIPDKQFVPNICGCNNTPILKNGVIQHG
jgi:hypothetical protein